MSDDEIRRRLEHAALPHLDAAYNLAHWLTHDDAGAQAAVRQALGRAVHHLHELRGQTGRAWLLRIVRHACISWLKENRSDGDARAHAGQAIARAAADAPPAAEKEQIDAAIAGLPMACREVLLLRELEDFSYAEIAQIADVPVPTVMARLARARGLVRAALAQTAAPHPQAPPLSLRPTG